MKKTDCRDSCGSSNELRVAIRDLPSVRQETEARAYEIYFAAGSPCGLALNHWLQAEAEALDWIDKALLYTDVARNPQLLKKLGDDFGGSRQDYLRNRRTFPA